jgi:hypothetical protein
MRTRAILLLTFGLAGCAARIIPRVGAVPAVPSDIVASVFLIGDAGAPNPAGEPVLQALERALAGRPDTTLILFLGDNVYPRGLPDSADRSFPEAARRLGAQVEFANQVPVIFLPGNHDWYGPAREEREHIRREGRFITQASSGRARLVPADGCPGPVAIEVGTGLLLLLLDTQWWLFPHEQRGESSACETRTEAEVVARLAALLRDSAGRQVIVAGHHPLLTGGPHGGYFSLADHLFPLHNVHPALLLPLPFIGSAYPLARDFGISAEDLSSGPYRRLRAALDTAFACDPPALYASGHEHGLQLLDRGRPPLLAVSGAGIYGHESYLQRIPETRLALATGGFMRADLLRDGRLRIGVLVASRAGEPREVYAELLLAVGEEHAGCAERVPRAATGPGGTR